MAEEPRVYVTTPITMNDGTVYRSHVGRIGSEIIETVEEHADGTPDWDAGGICDSRGLGELRGYELLLEAVDAAERFASYGDGSTVRKEEHEAEEEEAF